MMMTFVCAQHNLLSTFNMYGSTSVRVRVFISVGYAGSVDVTG